MLSTFCPNNNGKNFTDCDLIYLYWSWRRDKLFYLVVRPLVLAVKGNKKNGPTSKLKQKEGLLHIVGVLQSQEEAQGGVRGPPIIRDTLLSGSLPVFYVDLLLTCALCLYDLECPLYNTNTMYYY